MRFVRELHHGVEIELVEGFDPQRPLPLTPASKQERADLVNAMIREIGSCGRRFLSSNSDRRTLQEDPFFATFKVDQTNRIWMTDSYTRKDICFSTARPSRRHFSSGGTLWALCEDFAEYIRSGERFPVSPVTQHWGYPEKDVSELNEKFVALGLCWPQPLVMFKLAGDRLNLKGHFEVLRRVYEREARSNGFTAVGAPRKQTLAVAAHLLRQGSTVFTGELLSRFGFPNDAIAALDLMTEVRRKIMHSGYGEGPTDWFKDLIASRVGLNDPKRDWDRVSGTAECALIIQLVTRELSGSIREEFRFESTASALDRLNALRKVLYREARDELFLRPGSDGSYFGEWRGHKIAFLPRETQTIDGSVIGRREAPWFARINGVDGNEEHALADNLDAAITQAALRMIPEMIDPGGRRIPPVDLIVPPPPVLSVMSEQELAPC